ncbi:MAG: hypothetical protein ACFFCW_43805 [Candidatus Hodarchaeota archaeon]
MLYIFGDDGTFSGHYNDSEGRVFVLENLNQCIEAGEVATTIRNVCPTHIASFRIIFKIGETSLRDIAATVFSESGHNVRESEGIARVIRNRVVHRGINYSSNNFWLSARQGGIGGGGIFGRNTNRYRNTYNQVIENWTGNTLSDLESTVRGLVNPADITNGAFFWEGTQLLNQPGNFFGVRLRRRPPVFDITATLGNTTFMRYNPAHPTHGRNIWP